MKGKWKNELIEATSLLKKLENLCLDPMNEPGKAATELFQELDHKLNQLNKTINAKRYLHHSFFDFRLNKIALLIEKFDKLKQRLIPKMERATSIASYLTHQHTETIGRISQHYEAKQERKCLKTDRSITFRANNQSLFEHSVNPHFKTWMTIQPKLQQLNQVFDLKKNENNILSLLLNPSDESFLKSLAKRGQMSFGDEIGFLALQRLKAIASAENNPFWMKSAANTLISIACQKQELYRIKNEALEKEIINLAIFALLNPDNKRIWLGTARAVNAAIENWPGKAAYFNPAFKDNSWELDRAWLLAAVQLGYEFCLVEQHFPEVEKAILSGDPSCLIEQLAKEIRPTGTSQYNGGNSSTATPQEILVLLEMGCVGRKNPDNSLSLVRPQNARCAEDAFLNKNGALRLKPNHSCPDLFKAAAPPPLSHPKQHFCAPT